MSGRVVRIFLSSTFRDFGEERDLLVRKVFPTLRARLQSRFVDLVDVDLRWGITEEEAEHGEVLPICLAEIDRARPYFIGFLGERYGWVPPRDAYPSHVLESQTWLEEHRGGKSVTELEILHGVLNNPHMEGRALFYFRSFEYSSSKGGDYISSSPDDETRQSTLKQTIRQSGFPVYEDYKSPEHLAELLEKDLWEILDREFPASDIPDAFVRENLQHEAYALPRQRLYIGGDKYLTALDKALSEGKQSILVDGPSGGGKSALLANWLKSVPERYSNMEVHAHYLGATANATDPVFMVRRLIECIKRKTESTEDLASDPDELLDSLPTWLANASSWCELRDKKFLFVIDALNSLSDRRDLRWFPRMLPKHIHLVISTLPGEVNDALQERANWSHVTVMPLDATTAELVFTSYLSLFNKTLPNELVEQVMAHKLSANPLFLLTLAEELRLFGEHEQLSNRLDHYLTSITVDDLFERVLERIEQDYGADMLREILTALWAARSGLREEEILGYSGLKPMHWAYIRNALGPTLIDASGRLIFAHDYMRIAVSDRYMAGNNTIGNEGQSEEALNLRRSAHTKLANWFEKYAFQDGQSTVSNERAAEEIPYQYQQAHDWQKLQSTLTKQTMLIAILKHRSEQELLSYWLKLEEHLKTDIETQYEKAWIKWKLNEEEEATEAIAQQLSKFLMFAGRLRTLAEELLKVSISISGDNNAIIINRLDDLAQIYSKLGKFDKAIEIHQKNLEERRRYFGNDTLDVAETLNNIAVSYMECYEAKLAIEHLQKALAVWELKAPKSRSIIPILSNLAFVQNFLGNYENAVSSINDALHLVYELCGYESLDAAEVLSTQAIIKHDKGDLDGAKEIYLKALTVFETCVGDDDYRYGITATNLAHLMADNNELDDAANLIGKSLTTLEAKIGTHNTAYIEALNCAAHIKYQGKKYSSSASIYTEVVERSTQFLGADTEMTATAAWNAANSFAKAKQHTDAIEYYKLVEKIESSKLSCDRNTICLAYFKIAQSYHAQKNFQNAEHYFTEALRIEENILGADHADIAVTYYNLGKVLANQAKYSLAEDYFQKTLKIELRELGYDDPDIALTLLWLGESQFHQAKFYDAEQNLQKALTLQIDQYSERHVKLERVLKLLRDVSIAAGNEIEAQNYAEKIKSLEK